MARDGIAVGRSVDGDRSPIARVIWRRVRPECEVEFEGFSRQLMALAAKTTGYVGTEVYPPIPGLQDAYVMVHRYASTANLREWMANPERLAVVAQIDALLVEPPFECYLPGRGGVSGRISMIFSYDVKNGCLEAFADWRNRIMAAARRYPGYCGSEYFDTFGEDRPRFLAVVRFDSREHFDTWLAAPARLQLMEEVQDYVHEFTVRRVGTGFEGWFGDLAESDRPPPARWRQAALIMSALFPVISLMRVVLSPVFEVLPTAAAFLVLLAADVALLTWVVMPRYSRFMGFWLHPKPERRWLAEVGGAAVILGVLGVTLGLSLAFGVM